MAKKKAAAKKRQTRKTVVGTGTAGFAEERRRREAAAKFSSQPKRFWLPNDSKEDDYTGEPKNESNIIILDDGSVEECMFAFFEHDVRIDGKGGNYAICIGEQESCPLCAAPHIDKKAYHIAFLSVYDQRGWKSSKDGTEVPGSRKLLPLKLKTFEGITAILQAHYEEWGTIRGCCIKMRRNTADKMSSNIGEPAPIDGALMYEHWTDDDLLEYFGHEERKSQDGKVWAKANEDIEAFDYSEIFQVPTAQELGEMFGVEVAAPLGSAADAQKEWEGAKPAAKKRTAPRRRPPSSAGQTFDEEAGAEESTEFDAESASWEEIGQRVDETDDTELEENLREAATNMELDPDSSDYEDWAALGRAVDEAVAEDESTSSESSVSSASSDSSESSDDSYASEDLSEDESATSEESYASEESAESYASDDDTSYQDGVEYESSEGEEEEDPIGADDE